MSPREDVDDDKVWVGCGRKADMPVPHVVSVVRLCEVCQAELWVSADLAREVGTMRTGKEIHFRCVDHGLGGDLERVSFTPGQIETLLDEGMSVDEIAQMFAVIEMTGSVRPGNAELRAIMAEISTDPGGERAQDFLARAFRLRSEIAVMVFRAN